MEGSAGRALLRRSGQSGIYRASHEPIDILMKVETHNHPTAISPFPGAATGCGRRDPRRGRHGSRRQAQGRSDRASRCRTCAFPDIERPWEREFGAPQRIASALDIMIEGPIGAASFNNEFGRPAICGYFRTFEQHAAGDPRAARARLPQADHDRRRPRQRAPPACGEVRGAAGRQGGGAGRPGDADRPGRRRGLLDRQRRLERGS